MTTASLQPDKPTPQRDRITRISEWIHHHFLLLLAGTYCLAAVWPEPGLMIRRHSWNAPYGDDVTVPIVLLALLLFCAAAVVQWQHVTQLLKEPLTLVLGVLAVWLMPSLYVSVVAWALSAMLREAHMSGLLVGLALVAAMPVANSSVAWTQNSRGDIALGLGMIVLTILLSPVATPQVLNLMGLSLSEQETRQCQELVARFSGTFFILWVILPSLVGVAVNRWVGQERIEENRPRLRLVSSLVLLTLNYTNASLAMPQLLKRAAPQTLLLAALLAISLQIIGVLVGWAVSAQAGLRRESTVALMYAFSMKHTGLALVLAGEVLQDEPRVILVIVLATLLQHILAGIVASWLARGENKD